MDEIILTIFTVVFLSAIILTYIVASVRYHISKKKNKTKNKGMAKILFKSIDEYDGTKYPDLTTYHVTKYFLDCLIDGKKKTLLCSEYMYDFVQKGETYDVLYNSIGIELDKKYYTLDDYDNDEE